jgi:type I restriction enzyme M protein
MAIIQNGSPLFKGDAGSGESNIRGYLLENDWLEAIVQLPNDLFYNTGIATYIWVITRNKSEERQGKVQLIDASQCYEKRRKPLGNKRVEITETARQLIMQAYHSFTDGVLTKTAADGTEIRVESKVRKNDYFKYSKLFIMNPERDAEGNIVCDKKGKPIIDKSLNDTEIIPWLTDRDEYLQKNVAPYSPDFVVDEKKTKIGYEIPFTREFYKYTPLKPSADIFEELKALEQQEAEIMNKILH